MSDFDMNPLHWGETVADDVAEVATPVGQYLGDEYEDLVNPNGHGNPDPRTLQETFGHYVDHSHDDDSAQQKADEQAQKAQDAQTMTQWRADHPGASSMDEASKRITLDATNAVPESESTQLGDLSSAEGRTRALARLTQNRADLTPIGEDECGAASMVGGALLAGGDQGLNMLAGDIEKKELAGGLDKKSPEEMVDFAQMTVLQAKIAAKLPLTAADMHTMDDALYHTVKMDEEGTPAETMRRNIAEGDRDAGLSKAGLQSFIDENPDLTKMYKDNGMNLALLNTGERDDAHRRVSSHFVLEVDGKDGVAGVYDPYSRRDGQIINGTDAQALKDYNEAQMGRVGPGYKQ